MRYLTALILFLSLASTAAAQTILSFSPASGTPLSTVTLVGYDFTLLTTVKFNGTSAAFSVVDDTKVVAQVPIGATTGPISTDVSNTAPAAFFVITSAPRITSFSPSAGRVGATINIIGRGLASVTQVTFNGVPAAFTVISDTQLRAIVPIGATRGPLAVVSPYGSYSTGLVKFTVY